MVFIIRIDEIIINWIRIISLHYYLRNKLLTFYGINTTWDSNERYKYCRGTRTACWSSIPGWYMNSCCPSSSATRLRTGDRLGCLAIIPTITWFSPASTWLHGLLVVVLQVLRGFQVHYFIDDQPLSFMMERFTNLHPSPGVIGNVILLTTIRTVRGEMY